MWALGASGANSATGYRADRKRSPVVGIFVQASAEGGELRAAGIIYGWQRYIGHKVGDGARLAFEEIGRERGRTLVLAMDTHTRTPSPRKKAFYYLFRRNGR